MQNLGNVYICGSPFVMRELMRRTDLTYIQIYTYKTLFKPRYSLNSRWKAGFHEGREITYLQEINYLQEIQNITKKKYK